MEQHLGYRSHYYTYEARKQSVGDSQCKTKKQTSEVTLVAANAKQSLDIGRSSLRIPLSSGHS
jgi:hypothetical protein